LTPILQACAASTENLPPHKLDTDVNAPAMAEFWHQSKTSSLTSLAYVTVGTGVGVGLIVNSLPVHGMMHPEGGHICVSPLSDDAFPGYSWGSKCPYEGKHTVEGIASSVASVERLEWTMRQQQKEQPQQIKADTINRQASADSSSGYFDAVQEDANGNDLGASGVLVENVEEQIVASNDSVNVTTNTANTESEQLDRDVLKDLPDSHFLWDHTANAMANLCATLVLLNSIECIVLGGGIMQRKCLYEKIRTRTKEILNGYIDTDEMRGDESMKRFVREPTWGDKAGIVGALILGKIAYEESEKEIMQHEKKEATITKQDEELPQKKVQGDDVAGDSDGDETMEGASQTIEVSSPSTPPSSNRAGKLAFLGGLATGCGIASLLFLFAGRQNMLKR